MIVNLLKITLAILAWYISSLNKNEKIKLYWLIVATYWLINFLTS